MLLANDARSDAILVTGATGAVGRYVVDELLASGEQKVVILSRDPTTASRSFGADPRCTIVGADLADASSLARALPPVDRAVLIAASWEDGPRAWEVNLHGTLTLATLLRRSGCRHIVWFGTASILDAQGAALEAADRLGTPYIASKSEARRRLIDTLGDVLAIVHPTLVVAGDAGRPPSHVARIIQSLERYAWLIRRVTIDGTLHLVHARDLARLTRQLLASPEGGRAPREVVAGAPAISAREALDLVLERVCQSRRSAIELTSSRLEVVRRMLRIQLSAWDRYCLGERHFAYSAARLTLNDLEPPRHPTAREIVAALPR